jgi:GNAT superfamily N-acetyltransferase
MSGNTSKTSEGTIVVTTDRSRLDLDVIHGFLTTAYWSKGVPRETVARSMEHSLCFGAFDGDRQVGFARVISDVFALESDRKRGVGKSLMAAIMAHPELQGLRLWTLFTRDAHGLYRQFGFGAPAHPERLMQVHNSDPYHA